MMMMMISHQRMGIFLLNLVMHWTIGLTGYIGPLILAR